MSVLLYVLSTLPLIALVGLAARRPTMVEAAGPSVSVQHRVDHSISVAESDAA